MTNPKQTQAIIHELLDLALTTTTAHIHVRYASHVQSVGVTVYALDHDYEADPIKPAIYWSETYLDCGWYDSVERLAQVLDAVKVAVLACERREATFDGKGVQ